MQVRWHSRSVVLFGVTQTPQIPPSFDIAIPTCGFQVTTTGEESEAVDQLLNALAQKRHTHPLLFRSVTNPQLPENLDNVESTWNICDLQYLC